MSVEQHRPPRDDLFRAVYPGIEFRAETGGPPHLAGHFAVFNQWTEINSLFEGNFLERVAPGAFRKTFKENRGSMRVLFQHGRDPQIGDKPLGPIESLEEDEQGARYDVPLLDTSYNRDLIPGLEKGLYGASFRFRVLKEQFVNEPGASDYNPTGLPERTIQEASVSEFGPVTFPAYEGATAGIRSLTDEFVFQAFSQDPERFRGLLSRAPLPAHALPTEAVSSSHTSGGAGSSSPTPAEGSREQSGHRPLVVIRNPNRQKES